MHCLDYLWVETKLFCKMSFFFTFIRHQVNISITPKKPILHSYRFPAQFLENCPAHLYVFHANFNLGRTVNISEMHIFFILHAYSYKRQSIIKFEAHSRHSSFAFSDGHKIQ